MTTYAVGDIQGCFEPLQRLLAKVGFTAGRDDLWVAGDLVNRGPASLETLRFIRGLGDAARVVLGNHDLHLLAASVGAKKLSKKDTLEAILKAPDREQLLTWLRHQPLMHRDGAWVMSHAGVPHIWSAERAAERAQEVHESLSSDAYPSFLKQMYGNEPARWRDDLQGGERLRVITNYFTRMRFLRPNGRLDLKAKDGLASAPSGTQAWFLYPRKNKDAGARFLFGHWAALDGRTYRDHAIALDTGCVWGGHLTLLDLSTNEKVSVPAKPPVAQPGAGSLSC